MSDTTGDDNAIIAALIVKTNAKDATIARLEAEVEKNKDRAQWYDRTLTDLAKMCGKSEPTTHGLDYTTIIGAKLAKLEAENAAHSKLIDTLCEQARLAVEKEMLLNAENSALREGLAASENLCRKVGTDFAAMKAENAGLRKECEAWRERAGKRGYLTGQWITDGKILVGGGKRMPEADATDAAGWLKPKEAP